MRDFMVASWHELLPWRTWKRGLPEEPRRQERPGGRSHGERMTDELIREFPWIAPKLAQREGFTARSSGAADPEAEEAEGEALILDSDQMVAPVDDARQEVAEASAPEARHGGWRVQVLGGRWTQEHLGRAYDAVQGVARSPEAIEFCQRRRVQRSMRFSTADFGLNLAHVLARADDSRM